MTPDKNQGESPNPKEQLTPELQKIVDANKLFSDWINQSRLPTEAELNGFLDQHK